MSLSESYKARAAELRAAADATMADGHYQQALQLRADATTLEACAEAGDDLAAELARRARRAVFSGIPAPLVAEAFALVAAELRGAQP